ncbi:MAG: phosphoribosyl-ATP diphosphatase [Pseudomonadales bacterium]
MNDVLQELTDTIQQRIEAGDGESSYVARLHTAGLDKILQKIGEEATEVIIAAKNAEQLASKHKVVHETADLVFHTLVMLATLGVDFNAVLAELERRFGTSGISEKQNRDKTNNKL